jgi:hypothetical protein
MRSLDNVVVTPHVGYVIEQLFRTALQRMAQDLAAYLAGSPIRVVTKTSPTACRWHRSRPLRLIKAWVTAPSGLTGTGPSGLAGA